MNRPDDRGRLVLHGTLAAGAVLVPVLLGVTLGWPVVVVVPMIAVLLVAIGLSARRLPPGSTPSSPRLWPADAGEQRGQTDNSVLGTAAVGPVVVPSGTTNYRFELSAAAHWRVLPGGRQWDRTVLTARAREAVVRRAVTVTEHVPAEDGTLAEYRVASVLGTPENDRDRTIDVWATDVKITIGEGDRARLHALAEMAKDRDVTESERNRERDLRAYLGTEVLTSTGSALVWWLARHIDQIDGAVERIPTLARISAVAQDREDPADLYHPGGDAGRAATEDPEDDLVPADAGRPDPVGDAIAAIAALFPDDDAGRRRATRQMATLADRWERPHFADAVRQTIDDGPEDPPATGHESADDDHGSPEDARVPAPGGLASDGNGSGDPADVDPGRSWTPPED